MKEASFSLLIINPLARAVRQHDRGGAVLDGAAEETVLRQPVHLQRLLLSWHGVRLGRQQLRAVRVRAGPKVRRNVSSRCGLRVGPDLHAHRGQSGERLQCSAVPAQAVQRGVRNLLGLRHFAWSVLSAAASPPPNT